MNSIKIIINTILYIRVFYNMSWNFIQGFQRQCRPQDQDLFSVPNQQIQRTESEKI